ncbi:MAG: zinc-binding dehydrogenase [Candidatus Latescibacteria bacterium]|jgi:L-iditol 2-dehydrogenase|nr:zinc-binding dehydrogenase [Candidatus Latescibacterota bacterium]
MDTRVVYLSPGEMTIETVTLPELQPNQLLVQTHQASVCGSERYFYRGITVSAEDEARGGPETALGESTEAGGHGYPMGPLGHEGGGTVVEVGSAVHEYLGGGKVQVGDQVGSLIYPTYSDYWVTDPAHVQPIPDGVSFEVGCLYEPLGCAAWAALHMDVKLGDTVAVNGVGFAGNIMLQGAIKSGASRVIAVDVVQSKLDIARQLGADPVIDATQTDPLEAINELTHGEGVDVAIEAVGGTGAGIKQALGMVRHNGILALYGDSYAPVKEFCFHRFHEDGLEIRNLNAVHYTKLRAVENMREAYRAVQRGVFDLDIIYENSVSHRLDEIGEVFRAESEDLDTQGSLKTLIIP